MNLENRSWIHNSLEDLTIPLLGEYLSPAMAEFASMLIGLGLMLGYLALSALFLIWLERKISARIQNRTGPMLSGPRFLANRSMWTGGLFQTVWDALKLLLKELIIPTRADRFPFILAPILIFAVCLSAFVVIPFAPALSISDFNIGVLYIVSISSLAVMSILMAGWSSNNKYSLLGGLRSAAQMISYEVPLIFSLIGPIVLSGTLSMQGMIQAQKDLGVWFVVPGFIGFIVYFISSIAEVNRPPFDIPEAESELVAGYVSEYSGMMFAMFFLAEFCNMLMVCSVATTVFLGGWSIPFVAIPEEPSLWYSFLGINAFFIKTYALILVMMWIRWTFPRVRPDHLMNTGWKILLPMAFYSLVLCTTVALLKFYYPESATLWAVLASVVGIISLLLILQKIRIASPHQALHEASQTALEKVQ